MLESNRSGGPLSLSAVHLKSFTKTEEVESEAKTLIQPTSKQREIKEDRTLSCRVPGRERLHQPQLFPEQKTKEPEATEDSRS